MSEITYVDLADGHPLKLTPVPVVTVSSREADWYGIAVEQWRLPPMELPENATTQHLLTVRINAGTLEWKTGSRFRSAALQPGDVCLAPAGIPRSLRWREDVEILALALDPLLLASIAQQRDRPMAVELVETHGHRDPQVQLLGEALKAELNTGCLGGRLYAESLATALAAHLLGHYNAFRSSIQNEAGRLSPQKLRQAIEYIQDNLDTDLSLPGIAAALDMSVSRFKAQFKQSVGLAPHRYVIQQRVERARQLLLQTDLTPAEVAVRVGFYDQSHLTSHFKRLLGLTPGALRHRK